MKVTNNQKIETHILISRPFSNGNRDDAGQSKSQRFGGFERDRISAQCFKRGVFRNQRFLEVSGMDEPSIRSVGFRIAGEMGRRLVAAGHDPEASERISNACILGLFGSEKETKPSATDEDTRGKQGKKMDPDDKPGNTIHYIGRDEIDGMFHIIHDNWETFDGEIVSRKTPDPIKRNSDHPLVSELLRVSVDGTICPDIIAGGRMDATAHGRNIDSAVLVAHGVGVNRCEIEHDYFSAVDDLNIDSSGAAHVNFAEFSCPIFYQYYVIDIGQLMINAMLKPGGDRADRMNLARRTTMAWLQSSLEMTPKGRSTVTAPFTAPSFVMMTVRDSGMPFSLANAFLKPVSPVDGENMAEMATNRLLRHHERMTKAYAVRNQGLTFCGVLAPEFDIPDEFGGTQFETDGELVEAVISMIEWE